MKYKSPLQQVEAISKMLGLQFEKQDWGIINADGQRLREFISFYEESCVNDQMKYFVFELVLASANDALENSFQVDQTVSTLSDFLKLHKSDFPNQITYWASLENAEEFPIASLLNELAGQ